MISRKNNNREDFYSKKINKIPKKEKSVFLSKESSFARKNNKKENNNLLHSSQVS